MAIELAIEKPNFKSWLHIKYGKNYSTNTPTVHSSSNKIKFQLGKDQVTVVVTITLKTFGTHAN